MKDSSLLLKNSIDILELRSYFSLLECIEYSRDKGIHRLRRAPRAMNYKEISPDDLSALKTYEYDTWMIKLFSNYAFFVYVHEIKILLAMRAFTN